MKKINFDKKELKFARELTQTLIKSMMMYDLLTPSDFKDKKILFNKVKNFIPKNDKDFSIIITHQDILINLAKKYVKNSDFDLAYIFFAIYFEHFINGIFHVWSAKNNINHKTLKKILRNVKLEDKYTWLLNITKLPEFNNKYYKIIKDISEKRNAFIHYKYEPQSFNIDDNEIKKQFWEKNKNKIINTIKYCKQYESRVNFKGNKIEISKI